MPLSSIPLEAAPPPPVKTRLGYGVSPSGDETYDQPSKSYKQQVSQVDNNDNVYKLPPTSHPSVLHSDPPEESGGNVYKFPPSRNANNQVFNMVPPPRSNQFINSNGSLAGGVEGTGDDDVYKVPPHRDEQVEYDTPPSKALPFTPVSHNVDASVCDINQDNSSKHPTGTLPQKQSNHGFPTAMPSQEVYDTPPTKALLSVVPPPPTAQGHQGPENKYINLPMNNSPVPSTYKPTDKSYDFPVSGGGAVKRKPSDAEMLGMSPPPPAGDHKGNLVLHKYTNAPPGYVPVDPMKSPSGTSSYMPMDGNKQAQRDSYLKMENRDSYLVMDKPPQPPYSPSQDYLNIADKQDSYTPIAQNRMSDIYSSPPSNRPISESEDVYSMPPSNRPVEPVGFSSYQQQAGGRDSEIYAVAPSNKPVVPSPLTTTSSGSMLDTYPPAPTQHRDSTYDTPPPRAFQSKKNITNSPRFRQKGAVKS